MAPAPPAAAALLPPLLAGAPPVALEPPPDAVAPIPPLAPALPPLPGEPPVSVLPPVAAGSTGASLDSLELHDSVMKAHPRTSHRRIPVSRIGAPCRWMNASR